MTTPLTPAPFATVILDGGGGGTIRYSPNGYAVDVTRIAVRASSNVKEAVCSVYQGQIGNSYLVAATFTGSSGDTTTNDNIHLQDGDSLYIQWVGGDAGASATVTVYGNMTPPAGGFRAV